ncbi:MAG: plasma membrane localization protein [Alyxoria varia]|nr:MAG: plasma membrane localization protein [Alyxoria varia]
MKSIKQSWLPKHQVLILKCYPHFQKNAVEVKPNSSELSYLLHYADTRRVKLTKVGAYLEKKTVSDVHRRRLGNVQVTMQILSALIEKCPRDLPLFSQSVLNVFETVLNSSDINMLEASVHTFTTFCSHRTSTTLISDSKKGISFPKIVDNYIDFATKDSRFDKVGKLAKERITTPMRLRYATAGLRAIKGLVSAESYALDNGSLTRIVVPALMENLVPEDHHKEWVWLDNIKERRAKKERREKENALKRRQSSGGRNTFDEHLDRELMTATNRSSTDIRRRVKQDVGVVALECLESLCNTGNRNLLSIVTECTFTFATELRKGYASPTKRQEGMQEDRWSRGIMITLCEYTPVQDRFIILIAATNFLVSHSQDEEIYILGIFGNLVSQVNFIGISIIDIERKLVQYVFDRIAKEFMQSSWIEEMALGTCNLAFHIYYADQISDMIATLIDGSADGGPKAKKFAEESIKGILRIASHEHPQEQIENARVALAAFDMDVSPWVSNCDASGHPIVESEDGSLQHHSNVAKPAGHRSAALNPVKTGSIDPVPSQRESSFSTTSTSDIVSFAELKAILEPPKVVR